MYGWMYVSNKNNNNNSLSLSLRLKLSSIYVLHECMCTSACCVFSHSVLKPTHEIQKLA